MLGGEVIPSGVGLKGHSDGDALCHAITDAVLGAAAQGDIGRHFPGHRPAVRAAPTASNCCGAPSAIVRRRRLRRRKRRRRRDCRARRSWRRTWTAIRATLAGALGVAVEAVSVKGKTNEGMGEIGRGEGMAVHAVALLRRGASHCARSLCAKPDRATCMSATPHGAVQLAAGARPRRHIRPAHRRHRPRAIDARLGTRRSSTTCAGLDSTGTRDRRAPDRAGRIVSPSGCASIATMRPRCWRRARLSLLLHARACSTPIGRRAAAAGAAAEVRRALPRHRRRTRQDARRGGGRAGSAPVPRSRASRRGLRRCRSRRVVTFHRRHRRPGARPRPTARRPTTSPSSSTMR